MGRGFSFFRNNDGTRSAVVTESLGKDAVSELNSECISHIELNVAKGWHGGSIAFLKAIDVLKKLSIVGGAVEDFSIIESLKDLQELRLQSVTCKRLQLRQLIGLESLVLGIGKGELQLPGSDSLESLAWNGGSTNNIVEQLRHVGNLRTLSLVGNRLESLDSLSSKAVIEDLRLVMMPKLKDCVFLNTMPHLRKLYVDTCKGFSSIQPLSYLKKLESLVLDNVGKVETLYPVFSLHRLEEVIFCENTNIIDGKIRMLCELPLLRKVAFANRRHYDCKLYDLLSVLGDKFK